MKQKPGWETFLVAFQLPAFGTDGLYNKEIKRMLVSTQGGASDAKAACSEYHPGCRIIAVLDRLSRSAGLEDDLVNKAVEKLGGYK